VSVVLGEGGEEVRWRRPAALYADAPILETGWESLQRSWERSLKDLESLALDVGDGLLVPAAGAPWFMALFGRDALITGYQTMMLGSEPAKNTLRALARYQATERDDFRDAEPGKILHELRVGELAFFRGDTALSLLRYRRCEPGCEAPDRGWGSQGALRQGLLDGGSRLLRPRPRRRRPPG
jgi:glycogen debranching enzyme